MVSTNLAAIVATTKESSNFPRPHIQEYSQYSPSLSGGACFLTESVSVSLNGAKDVNYTDRIYDYVNLSSLSASIHVTSPVGSQLSGNNLLKNNASSKSLSPAVSDKISILFPKCRPKTEISLDNIRSAKVNNTAYIQQSKSSPKSSSVSSQSPSTLTPRIAEHFICSDSIPDIDQDRSPSNSFRKFQSSISDVSDTDMPRKQNKQHSLENSFIKESYWERRHNDTPGSTVLNSPETESESRGNFFQKQHIKVGRSPVSNSEASFPVSVGTPTRGLKLLADAEVLIFEDDAASWQSLRVTTDNNNETPIQQMQTQQSSSRAIIENSLQSCEKTEFERKAATISTEIRHKIKECESSPRRIDKDAPRGNHQSLHLPFHRSFFSNSSPQFHKARPGFPQRLFTKELETSTLVKTDVKHSNTDGTCNDVSEIGTVSSLAPLENQHSSFDYLYEFSETRKVLEEFFKCPSNEVKPIENSSDVESLDMQNAFGKNSECDSIIYSEQIFRSRSPTHHPPKSGTNGDTGYIDSSNNKEIHHFDFLLDTASHSSGDIVEQHDRVNPIQKSQNTLRYSPETTDYDSNCGDLDSLSGEYSTVSPYSNYLKCYASMPILEDGLSSGHESDTENNNNGISILMKVNNIPDAKSDRESMNFSDNLLVKSKSPNNVNEKEQSGRKPDLKNAINNDKVFKNIDPDLDSLYSISMFHRPDVMQLTPPPPAPAAHRKINDSVCSDSQNSEVAKFALKHSNSTHSLIQTICSTPAKDLPTPLISSFDVQRIVTTEAFISPSTTLLEPIASPVWIPRQAESSINNCNESANCNNKNLSVDEEEIDTDLETDRLLGHQRLDDRGFYDDGKSWERRPRSLLASSLSKNSPKVQPSDKKTTSGFLRHGFNSLLPITAEVVPLEVTDISNEDLLDSNETMPILNLMKNSNENAYELNNYTAGSPGGSTKSKKESEKPAKKSKNKEVLIEGVLFRARYLGSTQLVCEGQPTKSTRMMQAEEAVSRIKALAPDGEKQSSTEVDLFISTEKIMVLNTDLKEIMMDHALRTISYIADIGELVVLMARRRFIPHDIDDAQKANRTPKMICHVFESEEAQFIAQSIGQAFQVAYMEFLKANGIEDQSFVKEMDYQEVLNSQEIFGDELEIFAKKELQKEVVVPKAKGEILGVVIVESGWGSMLPTVVIANLMSTGAAARCGQLNIGDQLIAINGLSLVGLPLSTCQNFIKNSKNQTVVKFTVVPCAPVVEVKIKRPNTKYQLGFSVQNGVICSLLRGGIAERGGVRVGHRIIEINNQSVVAVPHEKIVNLLATSIGEILMKTMPTSMFRLLTGQENPIYI